MYKTIADVKARNAGHWFDKGAMRFFRTKLPDPKVYGGRFFISSEQFVDSKGVASPRRYSIREVDEHGAIDTVGEFNSFGTLAAAQAEILRMLAR